MRFRMVVVVADGTVMKASMFGSLRANINCIMNARHESMEPLRQPRIATAVSSRSRTLAWITLGHYGAERWRGTVASFRIGRQSGDGWMADTEGGSRFDVRGFGNIVSGASNPELRTSVRAFPACLAFHAPGRVQRIMSTGHATRWTRLCDTLPSRKRAAPRRLCDPTMRRSNSEERAATV